MKVAKNAKMTRAVSNLFLPSAAFLLLTVTACDFKMKTNGPLVAVTVDSSSPTPTPADTPTPTPTATPTATPSPTGTPSGTPANPTYQSAVSVSAVEHMYGASAVGDFDQDGHLDFVTTSLGENKIRLFTNDGAGGFNTGAVLATDVAPFGVSVADLNGDGYPDIIVAQITAGSVGIFMNNGDGTFASRVDIATGAGAFDVSAIDVNHDGKIDLVVSNATDGSLSILLGKGNGTFNDAITYATDASPVGVAVGDFDGDGNLDIAVASYYGPIDIFMGSGDGHFIAGDTITTNSSTEYFIKAADLNGDGKADLVAMDNGSLIQVFSSNGDGTFGAEVDYTGPEGVRGITLGDFNHDGTLDIAYSNANSSNIGMLLNDGTGAFTDATGLPSAPSSSCGITSGDFNGDGKIDLQITAYVGGDVEVFFQQ